MPAKNPRLTITLEPSLAAQLRRLSELTGNSQSALISELLEGSSPTFDRMIHVLEAANDIRAEVKGRIGADLEEAQHRMEQQLGLTLDGFDEATRPILKEAERVRRRAARASGSAASAAPSRTRISAVVTPLSNRGVRSPSKRAKK